MLDGQLDQQLDVHPRTHRASSDERRRRLAARRSGFLLLLGFRLGAADLVLGALGLEPVAVDRARGVDLVDEHLLGAGAVLLERGALRGAEQERVARILVRVRVVVVHVGAELDLAEPLGRDVVDVGALVALDGKEDGLEADGEDLVGLVLAERFRRQPGVAAELLGVGEIVLESDVLELASTGNVVSDDDGDVLGGDVAQTLVPVVAADGVEELSRLLPESDVGDVSAPAGERTADGAAAGVFPADRNAAESGRLSNFVDLGLDLFE